MTHRCFGSYCCKKAHYVYLCSGSESFWCEKHLENNLNSSVKDHSFDSILSELQDITKDGILEFLAQEKLKKETLKKIVSSFLPKSCYQTSIKKKISGLNFEIKEISDLIIKISEEVSPLHTFILHTESNNSAEMLQNDLDSNGMLFYRLGELRNKTLAILSRERNDLKTEQEFRRTCEFYNNYPSNWLLSQVYKEYIKAYQKLSSLYKISLTISGRIFLGIYDTESEKERETILKYQYQEDFESEFFIIQLPNLEWLIYCGKLSQSHMHIFDRNYKTRGLPTRGLPTLSSKHAIAATYFNRSIYFFECDKYDNCHYKNFVRRFDLDKNIWRRLALMQNFRYYECRSIVFNRNILIPQEKNCNLFLYSIDIDSFSTIIIHKNKCIGQKILINAEERLYLIESRGWIYESEVGNEYAWNQTAESVCEIGASDQVYYSYNNWGYCIMIYDQKFTQHFKFKLDKNNLL